MHIVQADSNTTIGTVALQDGESATFSTIRHADVVAQIDLIRADRSVDTYYLKQTVKGNLLMNKNLTEKKSNKE